MKKIWKSERGVAAIEMAIVTPFLLALTFGAIEFGLITYNKSMITNASREGARAAIVWNGTDTPDLCGDGATVNNTVNTYLNNNNFLISLGGSQAASVTDVLTPAAGGAPRTCTVTVNYSYDFLVLPDILAGFFGGGVNNTIPLQAQTVMRMEQSQPDQA